MNRPPVARNRRQPQTNTRQRYQEAYKKYVSSQFTYNSHCLLKKLCQNAQTQPSLYNVPLYKIMIEITKIMMMNQLQLLFFGATVQQMGWQKVKQPCLNDYLSDVIDITPKIPNKGDFVKKLQLSLLLIAYIVKIYLNDQSTLYDFKIRDLVKNNFQKMYQQWVQKVQNHFKFSPKHMNKLFKQLDKGKNLVKDQIVDFNQLVAKLFENNRDQEPDYNQRAQYQSVIKHERNQRKREQERNFNGRKMQGLPVHQEQDLIPPKLRITPSSRSQVSGIGKKESIHELFAEGQLKNTNVRMFSVNEDDFYGNGGL